MTIAWSISSIQALDRMQSDDFLFPMPVVLSPRRAWLERHGLSLTKRADGKWECFLDSSNWTVGETEEDAVIKFCIRHSMKHYSME